MVPFFSISSPPSPSPPQPLVLQNHSRLLFRLSTLPPPRTLTPRLHQSPRATAAPEAGAVEKEKESGVAESVGVLKAAAKTRKVPAAEVLSALAVIKKSRVDPSSFFETLGGSESPGRTWMLIFTAKGRLEKGQYFPVTAVQRFDAAIGLKAEDREPSNKDPFFVWFYVDEELAVAQGRGGGIAFWCRCRLVT